MSQSKKRLFLLITTLMFIFAVMVPAGFAATLDDITNNVLRVGNDFYSMDSNNFTDANLIQSIEAGGSVAFFKMDGNWYNVFELSDAQIGDVDYATDMTIEQNGTWYKSGDDTDEVIVADPTVEAAETAVAAYEVAPITTLEEITAAEALETAANEAVALVTDTTAKEAFTARIATQKALVDAAKADLEAAAQEAAAETAVAAYEAAPITTLEEITAAEALEAAANEAVALVTDTTVKDAFAARIATQKALVDAAKAALEAAAQEAANQAAAETAVAAYEVAPITTLEEITAAEALEAAANEAVALVTDTTVKDAFAARIATQKALVDAAKAALTKPVITSVSAVTKTAVTVVLAAGSDAIKAADKASYTVKIGEEVIPVTAVTYTAATNTAVLNVSLDKKEGKVAVNTVESAAFDYKAPEIKAVAAVSSTQFNITYSEAVNAGLAQVKTNYALVQAGTANVLTNEITGVEVLNSTQVRVTVNAAKLVKDTSYTVSVYNMQDMSTNKNTMTVSSSMNFVAIKDETKPTLVSAVAADANKIVLTMSEEMKTPGIATFKKYKADGTLDVAIVNTVALDSGDKTKMIVTITNAADYMVNGSNYEVTITGGSDLDGNAIEASQKADVVGLRDDVAPTITQTTFAANKLTITFSEKMDTANLTSPVNYFVFNSATGAQVPGATYVVTKNTDSNEVYITFNAGALNASTNYSVTINGQKDAAITSNNLAADTVITFKTEVAAATPVKVSGAVAGVDGMSVVLTLSGTFTKVEAETLVNYTIVNATDATKALAVTKAVYDSPTQVTLTTAAQEEGTANYKVNIINFTNLSAVPTETTSTFNGVDKVKPSLSGVELLGVSAIDLVFSENMLADQTGVTVSAVETGTANIVGITALGATSGHDNKIRVVFSAPLAAGKNYTFTITGAKDKASVPNVGTAQTIEFVAAEDTTAPSIVNVVSVNSATIEITFNEEVVINGATAANFVIKQGATPVSWVAGTTVVGDVSDKKKLTIVNGGGTPVALFENGVAYTVTVVADANYVADVAGNKIENVSYAFTGVKDIVKPTVVSVAMLSTDDKKLVITFSEKVKTTGFNANNYVVTNANTGVPIVVVGETLGTGEKANQMTITLNSSTVKGTSYRVFVANAGSNISDLAVVPNLVDTDNATALFTGIDTVAPDVAAATKKLTSASTMTLAFGEKLDPLSVTAADFSVDALTVTNAVVQANGTDVVLTFTGNTDTALAPTVKLKAGAKIADLSGNEATGETVISGAYTDAAKPYLVKAEVTPASGAVIAGQDGLYSVKKASDDAIGVVTLTFSENLLSANLSLEVYNEAGKVTLDANQLAFIKATLVGNQNGVAVFTNDVASTYAGAKTLMNGVANTTVTKLVFGFKDSAANEGSFTFWID